MKKLLTIAVLGLSAVKVSAAHAHGAKSKRVGILQAASELSFGTAVMDADKRSIGTDAGRRIVAIGLPAFVLAACASRPTGRLTDERAYCFEAGRSRRATCTPAPVPAASVDAQAKRFEGDPESLTLIVVRRRWADPVNRVEVSVDDEAPVTTVPSSFVRLRLAPGRHRLLFDWKGVQDAVFVEGAAGEVRFVELVGSSWFWGSRYRWSTDDESGARGRALKSRLIADLPL